MALSYDVIQTTCPNGKPFSKSWCLSLRKIVTFAVIFLASSEAAAQDSATPAFEMVWSIDGGPYGSSRSLEPTMAIVVDKVIIDANVTKGDRRHEVIRAFDIETGQPAGLVEHPDGEPFEGLGNAIAVNDRFMVTALSRKTRRDGSSELLVYDSETAELLRRIANPRAADASSFGGTGMALHDDRILAGVNLTDDNISTAWVFSAKTGEVLLTLTEPDVPRTFWGKPSRSLFGRFMAMNATHIAVAAVDREGPSGLDARGIVYIFDATDGTLLHRLRTPGSDEAFGFGLGLVMSEDRLYVVGFDETGDVDWSTGQVHAYDLESGDLVFTVNDPGVPQTVEEFSAGKKGWGFPSGLSVDGPFLFSGLPDWSGKESRQGGLTVLDARTGKELLTYYHRDGAESGAFGTTIAANDGHLAVMQEIGDGADLAKRVMLFKVTQP